MTDKKLCELRQSVSFSSVEVDDAELAMAPALRSVPHAVPHDAVPLEGQPPAHWYKLCGSLPNRLDAAQQDLDVCDNNNMTPASPAASEKDLQDLGYASERSPDDEKHFPGDMLGEFGGP
ncbi:hypothetical protein FOCC_FOCC005362 [Frankliniella occidentalis]|nr:hypothetical protein FOCC_FOCC005362 [Frankliniella occidentalis]